MTFPLLPEAGMASPSGRSRRGSHQLAAFRVCQRLADFRYHRRLIGRGDKPFRLRGTLIHLALAYHYASKMTKPPQWFYEKDLQTALEEKGRGLPDGILRAKEILLAYREQNIDTGWTPLFIEDEFAATVGQLDVGLADEITACEAALVGQKKRRGGKKVRKLLMKLAYLRGLQTADNEIVTCRPDLIMATTSPTGLREAWIVDHKSAGKAWGNHAAKGLPAWKEDGEYSLDWQVLVNLHIVRANVARLGGIPVRGFIIQRITREPDSDGRYYFDEHVLSVPARAYAHAPRVMRDLIIEERTVRWKTSCDIMPTPSYWSCQGRYGACDYRDVCAASSPEAALAVINRDFVVEK